MSRLSEALRKIFAGNKPPPVATQCVATTRRKRRLACGLGICVTSSLAAIGTAFWWPHSFSSEPAPPSPSVQAAAANSLPAAAASQTPPRSTAVPPAQAALSSVSLRSRAEDAKEAPIIPIRVMGQAPHAHPALAAAYAALQDGQLERARREYEQVQTKEPNNREALHGLAAIALLGKQTELAAELYRCALRADPEDVIAQSALINLGADDSGQQAEARLKQLIAEQAHAAAPHLALGNLYAGQKRWREARQAYFNAYSIEPDNPDLAFNLAVSLDQLRQPRLADRYYRAALAADKRPGSFNRAEAAERLRTLAAETER